MWGWFVDAIGHRIGYYKVVQYNGSKFVLQIILIVQDERTNTICNFQIATLFHEVGVSIDAQSMWNVLFWFNASFMNLCGQGLEHWVENVRVPCSCALLSSPCYLATAFINYGYNFSALVAFALSTLTRVNGCSLLLLLLVTS